jgi:hypothetical protein
MIAVDVYFPKVQSLLSAQVIEKKGCIGGKQDEAQGIIQGWPMSKRMR